MISALVLNNGRLMQIRMPDRHDLDRKEIIWIDLADPTEGERRLVQTAFPFELPEDEELQDLQASSRYYQVGRLETCKHMSLFRLDAAGSASFPAQPVPHLLRPKGQGLVDVIPGIERFRVQVPFADSPVGGGAEYLSRCRI